MTKHTLILNPAAGRGNGAIMEPLIREHLQAMGISFELLRTNAIGHAIQLAEQAAANSQAGSDVIVAVGGDGTLNEVLNGMLRARQASHSAASAPCLGLLPVGRGNDFGFGVGIPHDLDAALKILVAGKRKTIDIGFVRGGDYPAGRYFGNGVGVGFDAVVGFEALKLKYLSGFPSYIVAALKTIFLYFKAPTVELTFDDGSQRTLPALMVSVMNGRRMGGGFMMAPDSRNDDGLFDVCIASQVNKLAILGLIPKFMNGTQGQHPAVSFARTASLQIRALKGGLPTHADGETICVAGQHLGMKVIPQALEMIC